MFILFLRSSTDSELKKKSCILEVSQNTGYRYKMQKSPCHRAQERGKVV